MLKISKNIYIPFDDVKAVFCKSYKDDSRYQNNYYSKVEVHTYNKDIYRTGEFYDKKEAYAELERIVKDIRDYNYVKSLIRLSYPNNDPIPPYDHYKSIYSTSVEDKEL